MNYAKKNNTTVAKLIISLGYEDWVQELTRFELLWRKTCWEHGIKGRDGFIKEDRNAELLRQKLGNPWAHVMPKDINGVIACCSRNPQSWPGVWKVGKTKNRGKSKGHGTKLNKLNGPSGAAKRWGTSEWKALASKVRDRDGKMCVLCSSIHSLQVHHRKYDRWKKRDEINDLVTLCEPCHEMITVKQKMPGEMKKFIAAKMRLIKKLKNGSIDNFVDQQVETVRRLFGD